MGRIEHFSLCVDLILDAGSRRTCGSVGSRRWPGASLHGDSGDGSEEGKVKIDQGGRRTGNTTR